ncbi:hypothetical protein [Nocardia arthritidis]|uniref:Uncharacterized protein n=1 Tax=Nocardia arthritidis TaxID=228602 RepID=A0A6G9YR01_9NOCA|nr:hypothetical protein [Nocardia arthritidis]QIS15601.1 hypothetical protein F5544_38900 [Nocardia arthritidis]
MGTMIHRVATGLGIAVLLTGCQSADHASVSPSPTTVASHPVDTTPVGATWNVPKAFLGQWKGDAVNGPAITMSIGAGKNSEEIATTSTVDRQSGNRCEHAQRVILVTETELTFSARLLGGAGCAADGATTIVDLRPDGALDYTAPAGPTGTITAVLRRTP